jgi:hypothetical protein
MARMGRRSIERFLLVRNLFLVLSEAKTKMDFSAGALISAGVTLGTGQWQSTWAWRAPSLVQALFSVLCIFTLPFM